MIKLKEAILKWLPKLFSDLHSAIVAIILLSVISSVGVIAFYFKNLWQALISAFQSPTPLWLTILLTLVAVALIYINKTKSKEIATKNSETYFFTTNKLKWRVEVYSDYFVVDKYPFCTKHDIQFIFSSNKKYCPGTLNERCDNHLYERDEFKAYESVKSIIESKIRNGEKLC